MATRYPVRSFWQDRQFATLEPNDPWDAINVFLFSLDSIDGRPYFDYIWSFSIEGVMSTISVAEAKAGFANLVDEAANGDFVTITRHGKAAAVLVSVEAAEAAKKALEKPKPNFGDFLLTFPGGVDLDRNSSKMRDVDL